MFILLLPALSYKVTFLYLQIQRVSAVVYKCRRNKGEVNLRCQPQSIVHTAALDCGNYLLKGVAVSRNLSTTQSKSEVQSLFACLSTASWLSVSHSWMRPNINPHSSKSGHTGYSFSLSEVPWVQPSLNTGCRLNAFMPKLELAFQTAEPKSFHVCTLPLE